MTNTPDPKPTGQKPRRLGWLRWVLLPSLALNLLVVGLVVGHVIGDKPDRRVPRVDRMGGPMTFALSHEDRREIGKALRQEYRESRPSRDAIRQQYQDVIAALRAEPFDKAALEAVFEAQLAGANQRVAIGQKVLMDRIETMSPEERAGFASRLEEGLKRPDRPFGKPEKTRP